MKKLLLIGIAFVCCANLWAQKLEGEQHSVTSITEAKSWRINYYNQASEVSWTDDYELEPTPTVINGKEYYGILRYNANSLTEAFTLLGYVRYDKEAQRDYVIYKERPLGVFGKTEDKEYLLMDYSWPNGYRLTEADKKELGWAVLGSLSGAPMSHIYYVEKNILGKQRRVYAFSPDRLDEFSASFASAQNSFFVEGIGFPFQIVIPFPEGMVPGINHHLYCFRDQQGNHYAWQENLCYARGLGDVPTAELTCALDGREFWWSNAELQTLKLYDLSALLVWQKEVQGTNRVVFSSLPEGSYIYIATDAQGNRYTGKLVLREYR